MVLNDVMRYTYNSCYCYQHRGISDDVGPTPTLGTNGEVVYDVANQEGVYQV